MAIPLVYNSCLFNDALEEAIEDYQTVSKEREEQAKAKQEYDDARAQAQADKGPDAE